MQLSSDKSAVFYVAKQLIAQGFSLAIEDEEAKSGYEPASTKPRIIATNALAFADECRVRVYQGDAIAGHILFVFGNSPCEVVADWSWKDKTEPGRAFDAALSAITSKMDD